MRDHGAPSFVTPRLSPPKVSSVCLACRYGIVASSRAAK